MNVVAKKMTVEEFLAWSARQPQGRYELVGGQVVAQASERVRHARTKHIVARALEDAISEAGLACEMLPDGMTVRIDDETAYEPDCQVVCGEALDPDATIIEAPTIVVEVLSPATGGVDRSAKLVDYFRLDSVQHYLVVDPLRRAVTHHRRDQGGKISTLILNDGMVTLDPPGLEVAVADFLGRRKSRLAGK